MILHLPEKMFSPDGYVVFDSPGRFHGNVLFDIDRGDYIVPLTTLHWAVAVFFMGGRTWVSPISVKETCDEGYAVRFYWETIRPPIPFPDTTTALQAVIHELALTPENDGSCPLEAHPIEREVYADWLTGVGLERFTPSIHKPLIEA